MNITYIVLVIKSIGPDFETFTVECAFGPFDTQTKAADWAAEMLTVDHEIVPLQQP